MNRRRFLGRLAGAGAASLLLPHDVGAALVSEPDALPLAPLGPPPLCVVPRGHGIDHDAPLDYGHLDPFVELLGLYGPDGARPGVTWRELARGARDLAEGASPEIHERHALSIFRAAGVDLDAVVPDDLAERGRLCREWRTATGRFADGKPFRLPMALKVAKGWPAELKAKFVEVYRGAGAPWGDTETAAFLYVWEAGRRG